MEEIIEKLHDLNRITKGFYTIKILSLGGILLKNFENTKFVTNDVQELREFMYNEILKHQQDETNKTTS